MTRKMTVALNLPRTDAEAITYAKHIAACMQDNPYFPSPTVPIATLVAHIAELDDAQVATKTGAHGTAAARDAKLATVVNDLRQLRSYVETVANQYGDEAEAVVVSSGMSVKESSGPMKADFAVKPGKVSGSVRLSVRHPGIVASFDWQYSTDGINWVDARRTVEASVDVPDLKPGTLYYFRYRTLTREGTSDWSDPLTLMVV